MTAGRDDPRERGDAEVARLGVAHDDDRGGAVVERARVARGDAPALAEHRLEGREALERRRRPRPVVDRDDRAVGQGHRDDLALEEATLLALDRALLGEERVLVHLLAGDPLELGDVLGGLAHRDVHVGQPARVGGPRAARSGRPRGRARLGAAERLVVWSRVRGAHSVARDRLDAGGDEDVALAGSDRVRGHPDRLQRARAVAVDGDAGNLVEPREHGRDARDVVAGLTGGLAGPHEHVFDVVRVELGDLGEHVSDHERGEVVGPAVDQRSLDGPADRGAPRRDDHCLSHPCLLTLRNRRAYRGPMAPPGADPRDPVSLRDDLVRSGHGTCPQPATGTRGRSDAVRTMFRLMAAGPMFFVSAWLLMVFAGITAHDVGIHPFGYVTAMVATIGLWLVMVPAITAVAGKRKDRHPRQPAFASKIVRGETRHKVSR